MILKSLALQSFQPDSSISTGLLSSSFSPDILSSEQTETLWNLVDYGWLSDSARPITPLSTVAALQVTPEEDNISMDYTPDISQGFLDGLEGDEILRHDNIERLLFGAMNGNLDAITELSTA